MKRFLLVFVLISMSLFARPEDWLEGGLITPEMIASVKDHLELTAAQESQMNALVTEVKEKGEPLEKKMREEQKALARLLRQSQSSSVDAEAALTRLLEAEAEVKHLRLRTLLNLRDMLTPQQQKKAVALTPGRQVKGDGLEARVRGKASRLRASIDALGVPPTQAMQERGVAIEALVRQGDLAGAEKALDLLIRESEAEVPGARTKIDFSQFAPGDTEVESLKQRYQAVEASAQSVVSIALIRQLLQGKEALEEAKAAEDPVRVGRILTWAEGALK